MGRRRRILLFALGMLGGGLLAFFVWCRTVDSHEVPHVYSAALVEPQDEARVVSFCSACHVMPQPESFPKDAWHHEVMQCYHFYARAGRTDLDPPAPYLAVNYFRARAPEELRLPKLAESTDPPPRRFQLQTIARPSDLPIPCGVAHTRWLSLAPATGPQLYAVDMRLGEVISLQVDEREKNNMERRLLLRLNNPCHIEACDLDGNGQGDLVVADLGSFDPDDHDRGRVIWLTADKNNQWQATELLAGVGRVADVRPADFDADGDQDLVVAEFGWHHTGGIWLLSQERDEALHPTFRKQRIHECPGTIHVPVHDFNGDGHPDFVALVSQEYEQLLLFLNKGDGTFDTRVLWAAPDPAYGLSGVELVDLDGDADMDVLFTNGDTFDSMYIKPSHGLQWLENSDNLQFVYHRIADLPGAYCARAGDIDGDSDTDIIASVWLPRQTTAQVDTARLTSLVFFERVAADKFALHTLERGIPYFPAIELGDFDGDGDLDFFAAAHLANLGQWPHWGAVWWNN